MAANVYLHSIDVQSGTDWTPLAATPVIVAGTIVISFYGFSAGDAQVLMRYQGKGPHIVPIHSTLSINVDGVDLSELEVKYANQNARVFVFGQTRR